MILKDSQVAKLNSRGSLLLEGSIKFIILTADAPEQ